MNINDAYPSTFETIIPVAKEEITTNKAISYNGYQCNNKYQNFPPLMADGRSIISSGNLDPQQYRRDVSQKTTWEYRKELYTNGKKMAEEQFLEAQNDVGYTVRYTNFQPSNFKDHDLSCLYNNILEPVGKGGHEGMSDLKQEYLTTEIQKMRNVAPIFNS